MSRQDLLTLRTSSAEGRATIPVGGASLLPNCAEGCPAWLVGKAYAREIHFRGTVIGNTPNFSDVDTGTSFEIDAAYVAALGATPPVLRDQELLSWQFIDGSGVNQDKYDGVYYIYARDLNGPFTRASLPWFNGGSFANKIKNNSWTDVAPGVDLGKTGAIEILELEDIATQAAFDALTPSNPPAIKRVIATLTPPSTVDGENPPAVHWPDAPTVDVTCVRFFAIRLERWLKNNPEDSGFPASPEVLGILFMGYSLEIS